MRDYSVPVVLAVVIFAVQATFVVAWTVKAIVKTAR